MKKTFAVIAAVLFVLSFAASAFAIHAEIPAETQATVAKGSTQITLGGEIRVRGWYVDNLALHDAAGDEVVGWVKGEPWHGTRTYSQLINYDLHGTTTLPSTLDFRAPQVGAEARSRAWYDQRVRLYVDAQVAPGVRGYVMLESGTGDQYSPTADKYVWGNFNAKPTTTMGILESWILYNGSGLFGFNSGIKVGHMPLKLGEGQFFDHTQLGDDAIVFFMDPTKQMHVGLLSVKFSQDGAQALQIPMLGFYGAGAPAGSKYDNTDDLDGYVALMTYKINDKHTVGINYTYLNLSDLDFSHQNLGFHANGSFGNFGYKAEVDFQFGDVMDTDFRGEAVFLAANYKMNALNFRGSFAYGSGDSDSDNNIDAFVPYVGAVQNYTLIYDYNVTTTAGSTATGIANTTYYNLGLDYAATKDLSFSVDGYILRASKTYEHISKNAGWEVDGKMVYKIAKNLTYQIDAGYFKPGKFYEDTLKAYAENRWSWEVPDPGVKVSESKGVTLLRNMLTLSF